MDYNAIILNIFDYASVLFAILAALVFVVNIIVEVIKTAFTKMPTSYLTIIVSIVVAVLAMIIAAAVMEITIMWYYAVGAVVVGIFVSYAAMFGFDKLKDSWEKMKEYSKMK